MFKRKIENEMLQWKRNLSTNKKALLIKGLRQVGKTTSILEFAKKNFENVVYLNFKLDASKKDIFKGSLNVDELLLKISSVFPNIDLVPNKTVLIFDEVQECSGARASVKEFMIDGRFDVIESGSLLGISGYNHKYHGGVPVGFEHTIIMKPMDFEEFLWALKIKEETISILKEAFVNKSVIDPFLNSTFLEYFDKYIVVGGMPRVVSVFLDTKNMNLVRLEQKDILNGYRDDYAKHLDENEEEKVDLELLGKINQVFDSIPSQLAKENKKFMISKINKQSSLAKYDAAIQWLVDYGLISKCYNLDNLELPLQGNKNPDCFKIYLNDTGLFMSMLDDHASSNVLLDTTGIYKGAIFENVIAESFGKNNKKLYYYSKNSSLEIDFVLENENGVCLVEVKSTNGNAKSLKTILNNEKYKQVTLAYKLGRTNIGSSSNIVTVPYYLNFML